MIVGTFGVATFAFVGVSFLELKRCARQQPIFCVMTPRDQHIHYNGVALTWSPAPVSSHNGQCSGVFWTDIIPVITDGFHLAGIGRQRIFVLHSSLCAQES
jgi:hypothetical protein